MGNCYGLSGRGLGHATADVHDDRCGWRLDVARRVGAPRLDDKCSLTQDVPLVGPVGCALGEMPGASGICAHFDLGHTAVIVVSRAAYDVSAAADVLAADRVGDVRI